MQARLNPLGLTHAGMAPGPCPFGIDILTCSISRALHNGLVGRVECEGDGEVDMKVRYGRTRAVRSRSRP